MSFAWPLALLALLLVPAAVALYVLEERRRRDAASRWGSPALLPNLLPETPGLRRHVPVALLLLALTALLLGAARPRTTVSVQRREATVVLAVDVSFSMVARDVRPTRLAAAQAAALRFADEAPRAVGLGLVAFSDGAKPVVLPTTDRSRFAAGVAALRPGEGTALGDAVRVALRAGGADRAGAHPPLAILLISDGAQTRGRLSPLAAARLARRRSVRVYTVALGTRDGIVERPLAGGYEERIAVPPDPRTLGAVATATGGESFTAADAERLRHVYENLASRLGRRPERREVTSAFAGGGALLLLAGAALSTFWFRRAP